MIKIEHLERRFNGSCPIKDLNLTINDGDVMCIIGPSGTGKSTLLNCLNLLKQPTAGKIFVDDIEITAKQFNPEIVRRKISMVFQSFNLFNHLTVLENLIIPQMDILKISRKEAEEKALASLEKVGMIKQIKKYPDEISGGQKQRVAIARALVMDTEVILFDEPTSALDPIMVKEVENVIKTLGQEKRTMVIVTHDMNFAENVANRVVYLDQGGVYEDGTPEQIFHHPKRARTKAFIESLTVLKISVHSDYDIDSMNQQVETFIVKNKLSKRSSDNMRTIFDELFIKLLLQKTNNPHVRFILSYDSNKDKIFVNVKYGGDENNVLKMRSESVSKLKEILKNIKHETIHEKQYRNCITCETKTK